MLCFVVIWLLVCVLCFELCFIVFVLRIDRNLYLIPFMLSFVTDVVFYCVVMLNLTSGERSDPRHRHLSWHPESNHCWQDGTG